MFAPDPYAFNPYPQGSSPLNMLDRHRGHENPHILTNTKSQSPAQRFHSHHPPSLLLVKSQTFFQPIMLGQQYPNTSRPAMAQPPNLFTQQQPQQQAAFKPVVVSELPSPSPPPRAQSPVPKLEQKPTVAAQNKDANILQKDKEMSEKERDMQEKQQQYIKTIEERFQKSNTNAAFRFPRQFKSQKDEQAFEMDYEVPEVEDIREVTEYNLHSQNPNRERSQQRGATAATSNSTKTAFAFDEDHSFFASSTTDLSI